MKPVIQIDVVSDVVCPWCYIGKRRLEKAIDSLRDHYEFNVVYHPFELNPNMPAEGRDQKKYLTSKFGSEEQYQQLSSRVGAVAATEGLEFNFNKQKVSPNTRNAHRLIQLAADHNLQLAVVENLFKAYFTDGVDLSKPENLTVIATASGLSKEVVESLLASDEKQADVILAEQEMQNLGISGVPFYIVNNKYGLSGAQPSKTFVDAFNKVGQEVIATGESCDTESENC